MKNNKRRANNITFRILVYVFALLLGFLGSGIPAAQALDVSPSNISGGPGDTVTLEINIDTAVTNMDSWGVDIYFDTDVLEYTSVDKAGTLTEPLIASGLAKEFGARVGAYSGGSTSTGPAGVLLKVNLTVKDTAYKGSDIQLTNFVDYIAGASTTDSTFTIGGVTTAVILTPASTTDVVAGGAVTMTAEVLFNGSSHEITDVNDMSFGTNGNGTFGSKTLSGGKVLVDYTTCTTVETATITATEDISGGSNSDTATVASIAGSLETLTVSPDTVTLTADNTQPFTVTGVDSNGNVADVGTITWSVNDGIGTINASGLFDATTVGTGSVTATSNIGEISDTSGTITVTAGALATLTVSPDTANLTADDTQEFTVTGVDADDNEADMGTITWSVNGGIGTINATGLFDATTVGTGTVTATSSLGPADSTGNITVSPGAAAKMTLDASKTTLASDGKGSATLTATILDANNNQVDDDTTVVTFAFTDYQYLTLSAPAAVTATDGEATLGITTAAGTVSSPPAYSDVSIASGDLTAPDAITLTIVNFSIDVTADFVDGSGVHLVTSGSTPYQADFTGLGSASDSNYRWALSGVGAISNASGETITYTAPTTIAGDTQKVTLTLTSAATGEEAFEDSVDIFIYNPLAITWPTAAAGIVLGDTSYGGTATGGTGTREFQSTATGVATVNAETGLITPVATGTFKVEARDTAYGAFETANGFYAESLQIEIVDPITVDPATKSLEASGSQTFAATGGKAGVYTWTCDNADAGAIDPTTGVFTAEAVTATETATITATDGYDIEGTATITVYASLAITDKPETPPVVKSGESSQEFTVAGGDEDYTWTVETPEGYDGPAIEEAGASFVFEAPGLDTDAFAGVYTVTVTDGNGFEDSFEVYVPIKLLAVDGEGDPMPAIFTASDTDTYRLVAFGVGPIDCELVIETDPVEQDILDVPDTSEVENHIFDNYFDVTALNPGRVVVTVKDLDLDFPEELADSLTVDVIGTCDLTLKLTNTDGVTVLDVDFLDPVTMENLNISPDAEPVDFTAVYSDLPWRAYWILGTAEYGGNEFAFGGRYLINTAEETITIRLDPPETVYDLTVNLVTGASEYTLGDEYRYTILDDETGEIVWLDDNDTASFTVGLPEGDYRLLITGEHYLPYEYDDGTGNKVITLNEDKTLPDITLQRAIRLVLASHQTTDDGFILSVMETGFSAFSMEVDGNDIMPASVEGVYIYEWDTGEPYTAIDEDTPSDGDTTYTVIFDFFDDATLAKTYTVTYVDYANAASQANDPRNGEEEMDDFYGEDTLFRILGEWEFFPLEGAAFEMTLKDMDGVDRPVGINIPPIPLEYLYVDDYNTQGFGADNLNYDGPLPLPDGSDYYAIDEGIDGYKEITADTILKVKAAYFIYGGSAPGNGVSLDFEVAYPGSSNTAAGDIVRYNPIPANGVARYTDVPLITISLLLNPESPMFAKLEKLSDAGKKLQIMVSERGDGTLNFDKGNLAFVVQDDGLVLIDTNHLTSIALGEATVGGGGDDDDDWWECFITAAGYDGASGTKGGPFAILFMLGIFMAGCMAVRLVIKR